MAETDGSASDEITPGQGDGEAAPAEATVIRVQGSNRRSLLTIGGTAAVALLAGLGGGYLAGQMSRGPVAASGEHVEFTYDDADLKGGPDRWGELDPHNASCATGSEQSPIDVNTRRLQDVGWLQPIQTKYKPSKARLLNTGYTFQVNYEPGSRLVLQEREYDLLHLHFHAPSEHTINGKPADMELHLVHRLVGTADTLAVLSVLFNTGTDNPFLAKFWDRMGTNKLTKETPTSIMVDATDVLPSNRDYWLYGGSLTTPPCSQNVTWLLLKQPMQASRQQIGQLTALFGKNARPVQPLKDRFIFEKAPPAAPA